MGLIGLEDMLFFKVDIIGLIFVNIIFDGFVIGLVVKVVDVIVLSRFWVWGELKDSYIIL